LIGNKAPDYSFLPLKLAFPAGKNYSTNKSESVQCDAAIWCYNRHSKA